MKKSLQTIIMALLLQISDLAFAQQSVQAFLESYGATGVQEMFYKTSVIRGTDGFMYVCGATLNSDGNYDMLLTKMTMNNIIVWSQQYAGTAGGNDFAAELVQDSGGNIIITGAEYISPTNYNAVTIKYNTSGNQLWLASYNGAANSFDGGISVVRDASDNIYMCGGSFGTTTLSDFLCVKYNSSGVQQWASTWNGASMQDVSASLAVSATQVSVIGASQQSANNWKMASVFFNVNSGAFLGVKLTEGDDEGIDKVADLAIDANSNTYVVGAVKNINKAYDLKVIKLSPTYNVLWQHTYNGASNQDDEGLSLELTSTNDVVVCGFTSITTENKNFITRKLNGSTGALLWSQTFDEQGGEDKATAIKLDLSDNPIICGSSYKDGNLDFVVQKLKNTTGETIWTGRWNSDFNLNDIPMNVAIAEDDNTVYVAGQSDVGAGKYKYMVTEWSQKEIYMPKPTDRFASSGGYIQNREQLRNEDGTSNSTIKYYNQNYRVSTYLDDSKITYQLLQAQDTINPDTTFQVEMRFHKVNENNKIYPCNKRKEYHNYYLGHMSASSQRTPVVNAVIKKDVYTHTDVIFSNSKSGFRHWIVANTGAQLSEVEMTFNGQTTLNINTSDELIITTTIGNIVYTQAKAYTMNSSTGVLTLLSWQPMYSISGNTVSFIGYGTWTGTLVLEFGEQGVGSAAQPISNMNLEWSTYFGGISNDRFDAIETDEANSVWTVGRTQSAFFQAFNGETIGSVIALDDALAVKFDNICQALFLVYYGGTSYDKFVSLAVTSEDDFYVVGSSQSSDIQNETDQSINFSYHGTTDGIFVKFDAQGIVLVDSFIGGDFYDRLSDIDVYEGANSNSILLVGDSAPDASFEPSPEANIGYLQDTPAGNIDGFIIRLSGANELPSYSTYFGGSYLDYIDDVEFLNGNIIIGGRTSTSASSVGDCNEPSNGNFPFCTGNNSWSHTWFENQTYNTNYFLAKLNWESGNLDWCTYIGPAELEGDIKYLDMEVIGTGSQSGDVLVSTMNLAPLTNNVESIPLQNFGNYNQTFGGGVTDNGLFWFTIQGLSHQLKWCSYFGGSGDEDIASIDMDPVNHLIYITGGGTKPSVQPSTDYCNVPTNGDFPICNNGGSSSYIETDIDGDNKRAYIASFSSDLTPKWITQFGHGNGNASTGLSISNDKLFVVGYSNEEWTEWQYDDAVETDFYLTRDPTADFANDACIARFGTSQLVGLDENKHAIDQSNLLIYPNPTSATFNIAVGQLYLSETLVIYNVIGELIYSQKVNSYQQLQLDTEKWSSGVYVVALKSNFNSSVKLIVK